MHIKIEDKNSIAEFQINDGVIARLNLYHYSDIFIDSLAYLTMTINNHNHNTSNRIHLLKPRNNITKYWTRIGETKSNYTAEVVSYGNKDSDVKIDIKDIDFNKTTLIPFLKNLVMIDLSNFHFYSYLNTMLDNEGNWFLTTFYNNYSEIKERMKINRIDVGIDIDKSIFTLGDNKYKFDRYHIDEKFFNDLNATDFIIKAACMAFSDCDLIFFNTPYDLDVIAYEEMNIKSGIFIMEYKEENE